MKVYTGALAAEVRTAAGSHACMTVRWLEPVLQRKAASRLDADSMPDRGLSQTFASLLTLEAVKYGGG